MKAPGAATQSSLELVEVQLQLIHDLDKHPPSVSILQCPVKTLNLFPPFHCFCKSGEHIVFSLCLFVARADCEGFYSAARVACIFLHLAKQKKKKKKINNNNSLFITRLTYFHATLHSLWTPDESWNTWREATQAGRPRTWKQSKP